MKFLVGFIVVLFYAISVYAEGCKQSEPIWSYCEKNQDCVLIKGTCSTPLAVNKKFSQEEEKRQSCLSAIVECAKPPEGYSEIEFMARCESQKCIVRQKN